MTSKNKDTIGRLAATGALSGIPAGLAHALVNELDRRVLRYNADDMLLLSGLVIDDQATARRVGFIGHLCSAMAFGAAWAILFRPTGERDAVRKGIGAALAENTLLWPLVIPLDNHHPQISDGQMDRFNHPRSWLQACLRHLALGYVLGKSYPRVRAFLGRKDGVVALDVR